MSAPIQVVLKKWPKLLLYQYHWKKPHALCTRRMLSYLKSNRNLLKLNDRGVFVNIFPQEQSPDLYHKLLGSPQGVYCGFDPTADSLHIGNLLAVIALLHCQRAGHTPIALLGGATALIGDPSGKTKERTALDVDAVERNILSLHDSLNRIVHNHNTYFCGELKKPLPEFKIVNNASWYGKRNIVEFLSTVGRHFRMGSMLSRDSVKSRLASTEGMSLTEFTYQMFQSYDWLHLYNNYNCTIQIGGNDQLGNIVSGYELITRVTRKPCYGLTVPLVTTLTGDKLGKTDGNAVWLNADRTSPFELYQFYFNRTDTEVEKYLKQFTFICQEDIEHILRRHQESPHQRKAQKTLAEHVTKLVHGVEGLTSALRCTDALFKGSAESLVELSDKELTDLFKNAPTTSLILEPGTSVMDMVMKAKCFSREADAERIIKAGGVRINHQVVREPEYVLIPGQHILPNHITLICVGKKHYYIVRWLAAGL